MKNTHKIETGGEGRNREFLPWIYTWGSDVLCHVHVSCTVTVSRDNDRNLIGNVGYWRLQILYQSIISVGGCQ